MFVWLATDGAMNRALMSGGAILNVVDCDRSRNAFGRVIEFGCAHVCVTVIERTTYSWTMLQPSFGSTRTSPPSPPKFDTIVEAPGRTSDPPLSCRPPLTRTPPGAEEPSTGSVFSLTDCSGAECTVWLILPMPTA